MQKEILNWLNNIDSKTTGSFKNDIAFNFGIFESEDGYMLYLAGSTEYDDDDDDWACLDMPENPSLYFEIPTNHQNTTWEDILELVCEALSTLEKSHHFNNTFLEKAEAITTGFDSGDLIAIRTPVK
ncbi:hypothetical protein [Aureibacter tunicatorum]|uniref:Uncharacterized protein n=1 Tax=Aureibacter tunicatorum TaxID=866807 RepID=A0AAE4BSE5_9BACT|nr:hypothetical protein [Aureibacter tunicatorum]MDR6238768.1 hypothetical protein [Aureibacter tunicatorum]